MEPKILLLLGQRDDNTYHIAICIETLYGMQQHGFAAQEQELFGQFGTHAQPFATSYDDSVVHRLSLFHEMRVLHFLL